MRKLGLVASLLCAFAIVFSTGLIGQEKKPKAKGQLPANWAKLGLSQEQKDKIYDIMASNKAKKDELNKKLKEINDAERAEMAAVLTDAQKEELKKILLKDVPSDKKKPADTKKPDEKKPTESK
jgi:Spy/CpxP family protein refolding chaperone